MKANEITNVVSSGFQDPSCTLKTQGFPLALLFVANGHIKGVLSPYDSVEHIILTESDVFEVASVEERDPWTAWPSSWSIHAQYIDPSELPFLQNTHPTIKSMIVQVCAWSDHSMPGYKSAYNQAEAAGRDGREVPHNLDGVLNQAFTPTYEAKLDDSEEDNTVFGPFLTYIREDDTYESFARRVMLITHGGGDELPLMHCVDPWNNNMVKLPQADISHDVEKEEQSLYSLMAKLHPIFARAPLWHARDILSLLQGPLYNDNKREVYQKCDFGGADGGKFHGKRNIFDDLQAKFEGLDGIQSVDDWQPIYNRYKEAYDPKMEPDQLRQFPTIAIYVEEDETGGIYEDDEDRGVESELMREAMEDGSPQDENAHAVVATV